MGTTETANETAEIAHRRAEHVAGLISQDLDLLASQVTEDAVIMAPHQDAIYGKDACRGWWQQFFDLGNHHIEMTSEELIVAGDCAVDRTSFMMESKPHGGGETSHDAGNCVWLWRKQPDGRWLLARAIWNSTNPIPGV